MKTETRLEAAEAVQEALEEWANSGTKDEDALDRLALILDAAVDLDALLAALGLPWGHIAEQVDDLAIRATLKTLAGLAQALAPDPDRLRERSDRAAAKGRHRVAARRRNRARRIEARTQSG